MRGDFDIAITLACAAEGMLDREGLHMFAYLRDHPIAKEIPRKFWIAHLNADRDWLKHAGAPSERVFGRSSAAFAIVRAATKLESWTPIFEEFRRWHTSHIEELTATDG